MISKETRNSIIGFILIILSGIMAAIILDKCVMKPVQEGPFIDTLDSTLYWKNKANEIYNANLVLENATDSLKKEYNKLKSSKTKPIYVSKIQTEIRVDTVLSFHNDTIYLREDSLFNIKSNFKNDYLNLYASLLSRDSLTTLKMDSIIIPVSLTHDIVKRDKNYYSLVKSDNPYLRVKNQESLIKLPKDKKFNLSLAIGYGAGYYSNKVILTPFVGLSLGYSILSF